MSTLTGLGRLTRLTLRLDRLRLVLWVGLLSGFVVISAGSLVPVYPDQEAIDNYVALFGDNPALIAFAGPGYGFDDPNIGVILVNETQLWGCIGVALMSIFLVNRHTRAEEDIERAELVRSSVIGRHAPTAAAVVVVALANVVLAIACGLGFIAFDYPVTGSIALALSYLAVGLVFTGLTAAAAQIASSGRATLGLGSAALVAAFILRAVGDIGDNALRWLSPIGWAQSVRAFAGERWWTVGLCGVAAVGLVTAAFWLATRRDLGSGLLPSRPGPARAAPWMTNPLGLAVRLQRGNVIGWAIGMYITGVVYGSIGEDIEEMIEDNPFYEDFLVQMQGVDLTDSFFATSLLMLAMIASGFAIAAVLRLRTEETAGRADPIFAAPVSRWRWAWSHLLVTLGGTVMIIVAGGLGIGTSFAVITGDAGELMRMAGASVATVPPVLVLVGITMALYGLAPRAAMAAWAPLAVVVIVGIFGELLRLPQWSRSISPFEHIPAMPAEDLRIAPLVLLLALAAGLALIGLRAFEERDVGVG